MTQHDTSSLRYLFLAGEPLDAPSYHWVNEALGCTVLDHMWQTESGWPMLANCVGVEIITLTTIVYEGTPITPDPGIWWKIVEDYKVNVMFSAPTAIRILRKQDPKYMTQHDTSSLRYLFLAGEPLDAPSYHWVNEALGCTVLDHMWQTESGWPMLANCVGVEMQEIKPGSPTFPVYGWDMQVVEPGSGKVLDQGEKGVLVARPPLPPGALTTIWGDDGKGRRAGLDFLHFRPHGHPHPAQAGSQVHDPARYKQPALSVPGG